MMSRRLGFERMTWNVREAPPTTFHDGLLTPLSAHRRNSGSRSEESTAMDHFWITTATLLMLVTAMAPKVGLLTAPPAAGTVPVTSANAVPAVLRMLIR